MKSPLMVQLMGVASGILKGNGAIRPYWEQGLAAHPSLQFAIYYRSTPRSRLVAEVLTFRDDGQIVSGAALYA